MVGLGAQESGNPNAVNANTGAKGSWQVMPGNWPKWATEAGLSADAPMTPENQYTVVRAKLITYFVAYGKWEQVARSWYGGPNNHNTYSDNRLDSVSGRPGGDNKYPSFNGYSDGVMKKAGELPCK